MTEEALDKKAAALQAALELIAEQGFHGAPMSQIAERAGIGVGTIYRYFASKDDLINALYIEIKSRLTRSILKGYSEQLPVREGFQHLLDALVRYCVAHPAELAFAEQYENSPLITAVTRAELLRLFQPIQDLFRRALAEQLLKELPFEMIGALVYSSVTALAKLQLSGAMQLGDPRYETGLAAIWDMIKR
jgi:AcrR family transcriptional regulator